MSFSKTIICTDGAANRLRAFDAEIKPDYIIGDFDSISLESKEYFKDVP